MLTQDDLKQIGEVIEKKLDSIRQDVQSVKQDVQSVKADVQSVKQDVESVKTEQKKQSRKLTRIQKDISFILKYHDENVIKLRTRIERLEEHTGIPLSH